MILALSMTVATFAFAHGGGMGGGGIGGGGMMSGAGMMIVADDSSLLVTNMDMSGMMDGSSSSGTIDRDLVNIDKDGNERWRVSFTDGWPMMPTTDGDLVVVVLVSDWFLGDGGTGDHGNPGGGMGGGMGGGKAFGTKDDEDDDSVVVVGLAVATGAERWRTSFTGDMGSMVQFTPDGTQIYLTLMDMDGDHGIGMGSMNQGQSSGVGMTASTTVVALDREGTELWRRDLSSSKSMGGGR